METITIELTPEQKSLLETLSRETGKTVTALIREALEGLQEHVRPVPPNGGPNGSPTEPVKAPEEPHKPIWETFIEASREIPDEELDRLPTDGATQHDHYIYGVPKRPV
jgi:Ribbon-helix-helix domain